MSNLELKAILDIYLVWLGLVVSTGLSAGLTLDRYNRRQALNVEKVNKPIKCRVKKKIVNKN